MVRAVDARRRGRPAVLCHLLGLALAGSIALAGCRPSTPETPPVEPSHQDPADPAPADPRTPPADRNTPRLPSQGPPGTSTLPSQSQDPDPPAPIAKPAQPPWSAAGVVHLAERGSDLAISRDGRHAFVAAGRGITIVQADNWQVVGTLTAPWPLSRVAVSADGRTLAATPVLLGRQSPLLVWDDWTEAGEPRQLAGHTDVITCVAFGPPANPILVTGSMDRTLRLWDLPNNRSQSIPHEREQVTELAFAPNGRMLATGSIPGALMLWDLTAQGSPRRFVGHSNAINTLAFSADGRLLASSGYDDTQVQLPGTIMIWRTSNGERLHNLFGHTKVVTSLAFSGDGRWLASGSGDTTIRMWRLQDDELSDTSALRGHEGYVNALAFGPEGRWLASLGEDATLRRWNPDDTTP